MKKWTDVFISQCLDGLPKDKYRQRAQDELTDHLLELCADLESGGYSPEEAQARALELMGTPVELNPSFREEWVRRASRTSYCLRRMFKWSFYGTLLNAWMRGMLFLPAIALMNNSYLSPFSPVVILFRVICFLPGLWLAIHNVRKDFFLFRRPRQMMLYHSAALFVWLIDLSPILLALLLPPLDALSFFYVFFSFLPLIVADGEFFRGYLITQAVLCVIFPHFYRPKCQSPTDKI